MTGDTDEATQPTAPADVYQESASGIDLGAPKRGRGQRVGKAETGPEMSAEQARDMLVASVRAFGQREKGT